MVPVSCRSLPFRESAVEFDGQLVVELLKADYPCLLNPGQPVEEYE
jgi:hypothetical protein